MKMHPYDVSVLQDDDHSIFERYKDHLPTDWNEKDFTINDLIKYDYYDMQSTHITKTFDYEALIKKIIKEES